LSSNLHLYAYSDNRVKQKIISLFSKIQYVLPNLVTAVITRNSILHILHQGVTVTNIIQFLIDHFNPKVSIHGIGRRWGRWWMGGWMGGWVDGRMGGWVDGWLGGWVDVDVDEADGTSLIRILKT
jgi:hypothetical protein